MKLSDYVIQKLEQLGSKHMFMLPGGGAMHLNDSLGKSEKVQYVCCMHEQACSIAAEGYARVSGTPGLLMVTTGPGGTNALTGVAGAYLESTPMIVISGQVKRLDMINGQGIRQQGMQELDIISAVKHMTKYAVLIEEPETIKYHLEKAIYLATHGRKGPVWIDIPLDIQASEIEPDVLVGYNPFVIDQDVDFVDRQVDELVNRLNESERPVILAGNGIRLSDGICEFQKLVEILGIPVLTTWNGIDLIEDNHPLFYGRPGGLGHRYSNFIQQNSDFFCSIGARMNLLQTGYNFNSFAREAYRVMVDIDKNELMKTNVRPDLPIQADAKVFIQSLLRHKDRIKKRDRSKWIDYCNRMKNKYPIVTTEDRKNGKVNTYHLLEEIADQMTSDDIYVSGSSGSCIDISMQTFRVKKGQRVFCTKGLASMGYGLPAAIGACLAGGVKRTVGVNGDGGFFMNIQELETIKRLGLPIKIFVLNNSGYGAIKATQTNLFSGHLVACEEGSGVTIPNVCGVAGAFGVKGFVIDKNEDVREVVKEVLLSDGPVVCEVHTPIELTARPKQVSYKKSDGQMESLPLEFMNPMISDEEMNENMLIKMYERK